MELIVGLDWKFSLFPLRWVLQPEIGPKTTACKQQGTGCNMKIPQCIFIGRFNWNPRQLHHIDKNHNKQNKDHPA
jgi:hypothetical protein